MTRIHRSVALVLALATVGLCVNACVWMSGATAAIETSADTPLPPGWELCILAGVTAPVTPANVADLDEWQAAEGGSTNNTAAYNPFNTQRMTDATGAPIPGAVSANGFPAFPTWQAGCDATVATLFQPNMWPITAALRSGDVAPAAAFLAVVDQSSWCAPSANGVPCYVNSVLGAGGSLPALLVSSSALDVYGNVKLDLASYQQSIRAVSSDQSALLLRDQALAVTEAQLSANRSQFDAASSALRGFAINEYVSSGLYSGAPLVYAGSGSELSGSMDSDGVVAQQYLSVAATNLLNRESAAAGLVKDALHQRNDASRAVNEAALTLTLDQTAENRPLTRLIKDVATLEHAGALCHGHAHRGHARLSRSDADPGHANARADHHDHHATVPPTTVPSTTSTTDDHRPADHRAVDPPCDQDHDPPDDHGAADDHDDDHHSLDDCPLDHGAADDHDDHDADDTLDDNASDREPGRGGGPPGLHQRPRPLREHLTASRCRGPALRSRWRR